MYCVCVCVYVVFCGGQELRATLLAKVSVSPAEAVEELKARLQLKERLLQELLSDRSRQAQEHQAQVQDLLSTISARDQYIQVPQHADLLTIWHIGYFSSVHW